MADTKTVTGRGQRSHLLQVCIYFYLVAVLASTTVFADKEQTFNITSQEGKNVILDRCDEPPGVDFVIWTFRKPEEESYKPESCCYNSCTSRETVISIDAVDRTCDGFYQYNSAVDDSIGGRWKCTYRLEVHYPPQPVYINNTTPAVFENDRVALTCGTADLGNPPARFTGADFPQPLRSANSTTLTLNSVRREQNGQRFTCTLEYEGQQNNRTVTERHEATASLTVYYLPRQVTIKGHNNVSTVGVGDDITLRCDILDSNPRPNITWWKDGVELHGETSTSLAKNSLTMRDKGAYICKATLTVLGQTRSKDSNAVYVNVTASETATGGHATTSEPVIGNRGHLQLSTIGTVAGAIGGGVLLITIVAMSVICLRRRRDNKRRDVPQRNGRLPSPNGGCQNVPLLDHTNGGDRDFSHASSNMTPRYRAQGKKIIIECENATIYPEHAAETPSLESLGPPPEPSMQLSTLKSNSLPHETSSSIEPQSDTTPKEPPSIGPLSTNEKLPYDKQTSSSDNYPNETSTEADNLPSSSLSSDEVTNPKLMMTEDGSDLEESSEPESLHSQPSLLPLDIADMISDTENSTPDLLSTSTPSPADSNNLDKPSNKPVPDKSDAIKNLSESSETLEESIEVEAGGGMDQDVASAGSAVLQSLKEEGDEVAITIDLMMNKTPLAVDHLGLSQSKLIELYVHLYTGHNNWKILADKLGLSAQNIQVIDCCSTQHNLKAAEIVVYHWQRMSGREGVIPCSLAKLREFLTEMEREDLLAILNNEQ